MHQTFTPPLLHKQESRVMTRERVEYEEAMFEAREIEYDRLVEQREREQAVRFRADRMRHLEVQMASNAIARQNG